MAFFGHPLTGSVCRQKIPQWRGTHYLVGGIFGYNFCCHFIKERKKVLSSICHCFCAIGPNGKNPTSGKSFVFAFFSSFSASPLFLDCCITCFFHIPRLILEKCWAVWPADKTFLLCVKKRRLDWHLLILTDHTPTLNYRQSSLWSVIIFYSLACFPDVKIEEHPVISLQCLSVAILTFSMHRKMCIEFIENIYNQY